MRMTKRKFWDQMMMNKKIQKTTVKVWKNWWILCIFIALCCFVFFLAGFHSAVSRASY